MKEVSIEQKTYIKKWEATDGTQFNSREDCEKYENSAKCVILAKYKEFVIKENSEYELFGLGVDDSQIDVVIVSNPEAVDIIFQTYCFIRDWDSPENKERARKIITDAYHYSDVLLIGRGFESDDFYIIGTLEDKLEEIKERVLKTNE